MSEPFDLLLRRRLSRRALLRSGALALPLALGLTRLEVARSAASESGSGPRLGFEPIRGSRADTVVLPEGYESQVLLRWGDPLLPGAEPLDTGRLADGWLTRPESAQAQQQQFGYNCDALAFLPLDAAGRRGLLCVNHEYTNAELMFPGRRSMGREGEEKMRAWSRRFPAGAELELAAHGASIVEIEFADGRWRPVTGSARTRRITGRTPMEISGPARGHPLLRTSADRSGTRVLGMLANCAGGRTPWGTFLTAEENVDDYFGGYRSYASRAGADPRVIEAHRRFPPLENSYHGWEYTQARFDLRREPNEALRFGWIVEIDPRDPAAPIRKRTALGRFSHEGASCVLSADGRAVVYMGDDDKFECVYKFVSRDRVDLQKPAANRELLDHGTLFVARFDVDGSGEWLPLVHGLGPLTVTAGFADQGEVLIKARAAADLLGATPMDRPEDIEVHPGTGRVYVAFTKNEDRTAEPAALQLAGREVDRSANAANPRPENRYGHVLEISEQGSDAAASRFDWNVFLLAGDPGNPQARYLTDLGAIEAGELGGDDCYYAGRGAADELAPFACPDNLGFDPQGRLWIVTDGAQPRGDNNGAFVVPVEGPERGRLRQFMSAPRGAEVCGCEFTPDGTTLFLSVQHPGEGGSVEEPLSDWPDGEGRPPRPSVIAIRRRDGGLVGG
jgi:secreted PhoX family phosphatase